MAKEKKIAVKKFTEGVDTDTSDNMLNPGFVRFMLNCQQFSPGNKGRVVNMLGTTLIPNILPSGNNTGIGWGKNEERGKFYYFNYNDQGNHGIYCFDVIKRNVTPVLLNLSDTNNVDILKFSLSNLINHVDIVQDNLIYWVDGLNKARKFNIDKAIDKSSLGYGYPVIEEYITAYKQCGVYAPIIRYFTDNTRSSNYLYALQFKFAYRFYYDDKEISNWGDWSDVPFPENESYLGVNSISWINNGINVTVSTGNKLVTKIEIAVKINDLNFVGCAILNKQQLNIADNITYKFPFYNDGSYWSLDQTKIGRAYSFMPRIPFTQSFVKVAMTYGHASEGFEAVPITGSVVVTYNPLFLPSGTTSALNSPSFTNVQTDIHSQGNHLFHSFYWFTTTHFQIGSDVKAGNKFQISSDTTTGYWDYTAKLSDTSLTVASAIKQFLRNIDAVGSGTISNEVTDGSGNVSWDFTVQAHEGVSAIDFNTYVNPINVISLTDNGTGLLSIPIIKMGGTRKYAVVYEDDDGRTSLAYTNSLLVAKTLFETDTVLGQSAPLGLQQPIHTINIANQPPIWAKYWRLVRTNDITSFIQLLIQQVNTVTVSTNAVYLDLVVGSLFTYQLIYPDTILKYEFARGDRLRLISNENTVPATLYTPYFETEVLSYQTSTTQFVNSPIHQTDGSTSVTPTIAVDTNYIGKNIIINSVTRTITNVSGSDYVLDEPMVGTATYPNFTFIDTRGIIRIKKPPSTLNVVSMSLVEIFKPVANTDNGTYQNFLDFQHKYPISNWGTPTRAHIGTIQNQDGTNSGTLISTPAVVQVTQGDCYVRNRAMPANNAIKNTQLIVDRIADPNFSDFYQSNLYSTGRTYPPFQGNGLVKFDSRVRFSNNYIQDTSINGLNDFDNTDRVDYNDPYGSITLTKFKRSYLFIFKQLKTAWSPVGQKIIVDNAGNQVLSTSDKLLNDLQYSVWEGGIGNNGEGWEENGDYQYIPSANSGVFLRIAQDGSIPISSLYHYDSRARGILSNVNKYNLNIFSGFDKLNDKVIWSVPPFIKYLFNNNFNTGDWSTVINQYPSGTTFSITQQPAHSTATIVSGIVQITGTSTLGNDFFKYQGTLPDTSLTPVMNFCFTVVANPNRTTTWVIQANTKICLTTGPNNNGQESWKILNQIYQVDNSLAGFNMPNIYMISPDAIVPNTATITFNPTTNTAPSGGVNGDIWYNLKADNLYKNVSGVWSILTNRVINSNYAPSIQNLTDCPIPPTAIGILLVDVYNNTTADLYVYINTPGAVAAYQQPAFTGNNFFPNYGVSGAANCYLLSSDKLAGTPSQRCAFNFTKLVTDYPNELTFTGIVAGRDTVSQKINGVYSVKTVGTLFMGGSPGTYEPSVSGSNISTVAYTSANNLPTGANGTYGIGIGATILTFVYDVASNTVTFT
jgi:hypothetical protein